MDDSTPRPACVKLAERRLAPRITVRPELARLRRKKLEQFAAEQVGRLLSVAEEYRAWRSSRGTDR